jgi:glycosyltransferase involved in cell wall biosynthesis
VKIAVIVPVHNGQRFLAEAIDSIRRQSLAPSEVLVVDDGSTDGTADWLATQPGLTVLTQENRGAGAARNHAIRRSTAPILAFLDADDRWRPTYLERQLALLAADPADEAVFAGVEQFRDDDDRRDRRQGHVPSAMMIRREAFDRIGWFDETLGVPEFATWFLRAQEAALRRRENPEILAERRIHGGNKGRADDAGRQYLLALKQSLDRRRAGVP